MMLTTCIVVLAALCGQGDDQTANDAGKRAKLLELYLAEARDYGLYRDQARQEKLDLKEKPVYVWTNPLVANSQYGAVYLWTWQGRPEAGFDLFVDFEGKEVWKSLHADLNGTGRDPDHTYHVYRDRFLASPSEAGP